MKVLLGIHSRGKPYESFLQKVIPEITGMYPFQEVIRADSLHEPYNRSASRNVIVQEALKRHSDIVVIVDADSIPEQQPLREAIQGAYEDGKCHIPFNEVRVIAAKHTTSLGDDYSRVRPIYTYGPSCGGIFVMRPISWVEAGGMDERIVGWGFEDQIFLVSIRTFLGDPVYHPGHLYNFNHSRGRLPTHSDQNGVLRDLFNENLGNKEKIRELQSGSNQWRP